MGKFQRHSSCPSCGSRDNLAIYDDGKYCFGCGYKEGSGYDGKPKHKSVYSLPWIIDVDLTGRGINAETARRYGVGQDEKEEWVYFPYYSNGRCVGSKKRNIDAWEDKDYRWEGDGSIGLWGMQTSRENHKSIIITEGELDALAASVMYGLKHSIVSLAHGAKGAANDLKQHIEFLERFERIYLCFDMDDVGRQAIDEVLPILDDGRARVVILPKDFKDANDMLKAGKDKEFRQCVDSAQEYMPPEMITGEALVQMGLDEIRQSSPDNRKSTGFAKLDNIIGGFNKNELITIAAYTGIGKTTLAMQLALRAMEQGLKVFLLTLETTPGSIIRQLAEMRSQYRIYSDPIPSVIPEENYIEDMRWIGERCTAFNQLGSMSLELLESRIKHAAKTGHEVVILDHITAATQTMDGKQVQVIDTTMAMLNRVTVRHGLWTLVVSHVSRDKDDRNRQKLTLNSLRNSEGIAQYSHAVLGLVRRMGDDIARVVVLKAHRKYGRVEDFYLRWDKDNRRFYEQDDVIDAGLEPQEESSKSADESQVVQQVQGKTERVERRDDKLQEQVRENSTRSEPAPSVRVHRPDLHTELHTRLYAYYKDRQDYLCGDEGVSETGGQVKTDSCQKGESRDILETLISGCVEQEPSEIQEWFKLRRMGEP